MKDIKFFLRKRIKLLGGFSDYKKDTYKLQITYLLTLVDYK